MGWHVPLKPAEIVPKNSLPNNRVKLLGNLLFNALESLFLWHKRQSNKYKMVIFLHELFLPLPHAFVPTEE